MADSSEDFDDIRYQHHLKHRGTANHRLFLITWCIIAFIILTAVARKASRWWNRRRHSKRPPTLTVPPVVRNIQKRTSSLLKAVSILPTPQITSLAIRGLTIGRLYLLLIYTAVITFSLTIVNAPIFSQHFIDDIAFRAAWVTITQIPLVYLLSAKRGPINLFIDLSYERVNWMHRWVGKMVFVSGTIHMAIMKSSISVRDIRESNEEATSILPLRSWSYRTFYINHWISTIAFLAFVFQHVPVFARTPIYIATSIVMLDKALLAYFFLNMNVSVRPLKRRFARFSRGSGRRMLIAGFPVEMVAPSILITGLPTQTMDRTTIIRISKLPFSWKPGQHIRLFIPALGAFEIHPFTPANCSALLPPPLPPRKDIEEACNIGIVATQPPRPTSEMILMVRAHSGLTNRLANYYAEWLAHPCPNASEPTSTLTAYVDGPYGEAPSWDRYENLTLIATSTGVSFILSIMDHLEQLCFLGDEKLKTKGVTFVWVTRHLEPHFEHFVEDLISRYSMLLCESGIGLEVEFYTTCPRATIESEPPSHDPFAHLRFHTQGRLSGKPTLRIRNPDEIYDEWDREAEIERLGQKEAEPFFTEMDSSTRTSFESDEISQISTCVEGNGEDDLDGDPFSDAYKLSGEDASYRPLPPSRPLHHEPTTSNKSEKDSRCECGIIQHQKKKGPTKNISKNFIHRTYAMRPDFGETLSKAIPRLSADSAMVAVCANENVTRDIRKVVAKMNVDFTLRRRATSVQLFSEGFG
ncbi:hypothetical protein BKA66DRAFT_579616 [Pyrenochaeta sp. MPI-SDFR-AT-0127]|nr:hypothetical protein BKA66DRAFT_579616 [Pyrenochaeta sp. MPI-SDFR-AT-0127]